MTATNPTLPPEFVRTRDVAARYGVTTQSVRNWIRQGVFPVARKGKLIRIRLADVIDALEVKGETK